MHLLRTQTGVITDGSEAIDLGQTPGAIVFLSAADTELALLADAHALAEKEHPYPSLRLANWMQLSHNLSVDMYAETIIARAQLVIIRLLGGVAYWSYGIEQLQATCQEQGIPLAILPGDDQPDAELAALSSLAPEACHRLWQYCVHGGPDNAREWLNYSAHLLNQEILWREPKPLLRAGLYWPDHELLDWTALQTYWQTDQPVAAIIFYRALLQAGDLAPVDALITALQQRQINPLPLFCSSLKDPVAAETIGQWISTAQPGVILNATGFAVATPNSARPTTPFDSADCPILQVVFSGGTQADWASGTQGLSARNIAMNVTLPEVDGRVLSRAVAFKSQARFDDHTQCQVIRYEVLADRVEFVTDLARNWIKLQTTSEHQRRLAIVLANYPNRDGRLGNGVGLDTPASTFNVLKALQTKGYTVNELPTNGQALIQRLAAGPTNDLSVRQPRQVQETLSMADYQLWFSRQPQTLREQVLQRWGAPQSDPFFQAGEVDCGRFVLSAFRLGQAVIALQPARGYNIDPVASYHDPDLVPPHGYLALYAWLQVDVQVHAIIHMGKHGNLEWLPGKALALSNTCFPEAALGPLPHFYPFIVNDPGEGTQAKRRAQAVIIDHLTPPLTRAESYGPLAELEQLVDEYFEASGSDPRRLRILREHILQRVQFIGLDRDCGIHSDDDADTALAKLDTYLCELKEMQIRDGLHIFGESPSGELLTDLLIALSRLPRRDGQGGDASLLRALAKDLQLDFDPLDCDLGAAWTGTRPAVLGDDQPWRHCGDTVERLEQLAKDLVSGQRAIPSAWPATAAVLHTIETQLRPAVCACGAAEIRALLRGLDGRFVAPGPSGAPTRGRPDVLPTGRNFYSIDNRTVPTPAAYTLGWASASLLLEHHRQEHGEWPQRVALSAWGTANMRTGGDDIAQALALLGVKPTWDQHSRRVTGFEVLPLDILDRPRVDVTLRVSGFFRDAFPAQIDLVDSAVRAIAALDEPEALNPLAAAVQRDQAALCQQGLDPQQAQLRAGFRVFGAKPGAYGAGLQALIDERGWQTDADFAHAYLAWGGYAYGSGSQGVAEQQLFAQRLGQVQAVLHNQDNREHDVLDSDDYYQFEGGLAATIRHLSGRQPVLYHNDHSRPESPKIRTLQEEIARVVRARVANPKWIRGVMRHGYKGAFELAATVDYMFAFAATARVVDHHHFDAVFAAYLQDDEVLSFLRDNNPSALKEIAERLLEALQRGLWQARSNSAQSLLHALASREPQGTDHAIRH